MRKPEDFHASGPLGLAVVILSTALWYALPTYPSDWDLCRSAWSDPYTSSWDDAEIVNQVTSLKKIPVAVCACLHNCWRRESGCAAVSYIHALNPTTFRWRAKDPICSISLLPRLTGLY